MGYGRSADDDNVTSLESGGTLDHVIEVFPTGETMLVAPDEHPVTDRFRSGLDHAFEFHARPGHRPGATSTTSPPTASARHGGESDIVRPVRADPRRACELAMTGRLFSEPVPHLTIEHHPDDVDEQRALTWDAVLTTGRHHRQPARLHLLASPSLVVTVIELVPCRRVGRHKARFIRAGVQAIDVLARRLEVAVNNDQPDRRI